MTIAQITQYLESIAPANLQESFDNAGLLTGQSDWPCTGILISLDATEEVVKEAVEKGCNLVVSHHPIVFSGLKKINGKNYVERAVIAAIRNDIALFAIHTNLDHVWNGVNGKIADLIGLQNKRVLLPKEQLLMKLITYVPEKQADQVRQALFDAGAGTIGHYNECSFSVSGSGTFKGDDTTQPFAGVPGVRQTEPEQQVQVIVPNWLQGKVQKALLQAHPYEEVAFDWVSLNNTHPQIGSGMIGELETPMNEPDFLQLLKDRFGVPIVRHTPFLGKPIQKVAVCGGAGSFLTKVAKSSGADCFVTADLKYHEFFDADGQLLLADIGHFESEQFTIDLLFDVLREKYPNFAVLKTGIVTNPVQYF